MIDADASRSGQQDRQLGEGQDEQDQQCEGDCALLVVCDQVHWLVPVITH